MQVSATPDRPEAPASRRPRDLILSLFVLLVPVLVLVGGYQMITGRDGPVPVDQTTQIDAARRAGFDVMVPDRLDPAWVPVSADFQRVDGGLTLRLGYLTPDGAPVQVVQSTLPPEALLAGELASDRDGSPASTGTVSVAGVTWHRYPGRPGETALVRHRPGHVVVVVGPAAEAELRDLAAALR